MGKEIEAMWLAALLFVALGVPSSAAARQEAAPPATVAADMALIERADQSRAYIVDESAARIDEFVDFACPTCQSFYVLKTDSLKSELVDTNRANFVVRMFPLPRLMRGFHAAEAALCAGAVMDKRGFEAMQHRLFMNQSVWQPLQDPIPVFLQFAVDIGLPMEEFQQCLIRDAVAPLILSDMNMAQMLEVTGTPTFVLNRGTELVGDVKLTADDGIQAFVETVTRLSAGSGGG